MHLVHELRRQRVLRGLLAYALAAFAALQGLDVLVNSLALPRGIMTGVSVAALAGLPVAAVLAWLFDFTSGGIRRTGHTEELLPGVAAATHRGSSRWHSWGPFVLLLALTTVSAVLVIRLLRREARVRWALQDALPRVVELADRSRYAEAFALAEQIAQVVPEDRRLAKLWPELSRLYTIETSPPGADVYVKSYGSPDAPWRLTGRSPVADFRLPLDLYRWRIEKPGFESVHAAAGNVRPARSSSDERITLRFELDETGHIPAGMVRVPGASVTILVPGLDHLPAQALGAYFIDRTEVTNAAFKRFVDAGGYLNRNLWKHELVRDGRVVPWAEAMRLFRDRTGRPGPATWTSGDYPEGQGEWPVTGVSWYEAAAYAEFVGKALPNVYQWSRAAWPVASAQIIPLSNFGRKGPAPVASHRGMGPFGTYDMAGNAKEWCWNATEGGKRYVLGGAWDEPSYMFTDADAQPAFTRPPNFGFRLVKNADEGTAPAAMAPIALLERNYTKEKPVPEELARAFTRLYSYDPAPLEARTESTDDSSDRWRKEKVSFTAAYGGERIVAYLFTPRSIPPPYQPVIFFPGSNAILLRSSEELDYLWIMSAVVRSGRALLLPVYKSTYERGDGVTSDVPNRSASYRDHVMMWAKDVRRSIDYLDTRGDLDHGHLALYGFSWGAALAPLLLAVEPRINVAIMLGGGLCMQDSMPEADPFNFAPLVRQPMLMLNGRYDFFFPVDTSQRPLFDRLGSAPADKRHVVFDAGHLPPNDLFTKEVLDWLDRHLGPVG